MNKQSVVYASSGILFRLEKGNSYTGCNMDAPGEEVSQSNIDKYYDALT
jgi:hypothetical protein